MGLPLDSCGPSSSLQSLLDPFFSTALDFSHSLTNYRSNDKAVSQISSNSTLSVTEKTLFLCQIWLH